jgi:hypothetical protein
MCQLVSLYLVEEEGFKMVVAIHSMLTLQLAGRDVCLIGYKIRSRKHDMLYM